MADKDKEAKEARKKRAQRLQALVDQPGPPPPRSPHAFVQEQMRKIKPARKVPPSAPSDKKES